MVKRNYSMLLLGGVAMLTAGVGLWSLAGDFFKSTPVPQNIPVVSRSLESITFEEARKTVLEKAPNEEEVVQTYLNQLFNDKEKHDLGIDGWDSFKDFVYDQELNKIQEEFNKRGLECKATNEKYQDTSKGFLMIATPYFGKNGEKIDAYVSRKTFEHCESQDELLSALDNEAYHAGWQETGNVHLNPGIPEIKDYNLGWIMHELFSFDLQFKGIYYGHRKVRNQFIKGSYGGARVLFQELEKVCEEGSERSSDAKRIFNCLLAQPTAQFFVPKAERASKRPYRLD